MKAGRYRKKPVVIDAMFYDGSKEAYKVACEFLGDDLMGAESAPGGTVALRVKTWEGSLHAEPGCWLIRGVKGEHYPCEAGVFEETYEPEITSDEHKPTVTP